MTSIPFSLTSKCFEGKATFGTSGASLTWRELKARVGIPELLGEIGMFHGFRRRSHHWVGPCPIHGGDNHAAFTIDTERNLWYCFTRCGQGGTVIDLALALCSNSWPVALELLSRLAQKAGQIGVFPLPDNHLRSKQILPKISESAFKPFCRILPLDPTHPFLARLGIRPETIRFFEAGAWNGLGFLNRTIAIRLHDPAGNPLGYAGRRLDPQEICRWGKWKWPRHFPKANCLYNWHRVQSHLSRGLIVVEGAWSVMKLHQAGVPGVVALGGTGISIQQRQLLSLSRKIALFLDGDEAGRAATKKLIQEKIHPNLFVINCNDGLDPADLPEERLIERTSHQLS